MRYIDVEENYIPKHCIYGPRPAMGIVFNDLEWWSITDHLIKYQRDKELAAVLKAKEDAKKEISFNMTRTWDNTLASIKTKGNEKRIQKQEKIKQDRMDAYHQILKSKKESKDAILSSVKKKLFEDKDAVKTVKSALMFSMVLGEREKQIEMQKLLRAQEEKELKEWETKVKKDAEDHTRETLEEEIRQKEKLRIQKQYLDRQIEDQKRRKAVKDDFEQQKQDMINMKIEGAKIHQCNTIEKNYRKDFAARYMKKTQNQLELERKLALEEEEENEINNIYKAYDKKFKKERKEREERIKNEQVERRQKISEMLAQRFEAAKLKEEESYMNAVREKEEQYQKEEELKKERKRQSLADLLEGKKRAEEDQAKTLYEEKERKKWEMIQQYRSAEVNEEWKKNQLIQQKENYKELAKGFDQQCKENAKRHEQELQEWLEPLEDETAEREELSGYFQETLDFAKKNGWPDHPLHAAISEMKKTYGIPDKKKEEFDQKRKEKEEAAISENLKQKTRPNAIGCYCFKY